MASIQFQDPKEAAQVASGRKFRDIRFERDEPIYSGDNLFLFRVEDDDVLELGRAICREVKPIAVGQRIRVGDRELSLDQSDKLARENGFENMAHMITHYGDKQGVPFQGVMIEWVKK